MLTFKPASTHMVFGQSGSGKTSYIFQVLRNKDKIFGDQEPQIIRFHYAIWQKSYDDVLSEIEGISFHQGLPTMEEIMEVTNPPNDHVVYILDDLQSEACKSDLVELIFTRVSHHRNLTCFYLLQNPYVQGKNQVTISMNTIYLTILRNPRGALQLKYANAQLFPNHKNFLTQAYEDVMKSDSFGYLLVDLSAHCPQELRVRTKIFPGEQTIIYKPE